MKGLHALPGNRAGLRLQQKQLLCDCEIPGRGGDMQWPFALPVPNVHAEVVFVLPLVILRRGRLAAPRKLRGFRSKPPQLGRVPAQRGLWTKAQIPAPSFPADPRRCVYHHERRSPARIPDFTILMICFSCLGPPPHHGLEAGFREWAWLDVAGQNRQKGKKEGGKDKEAKTTETKETEARVMEERNEEERRCSLCLLRQPRWRIWSRRCR